MENEEILEATPEVRMEDTADYKEFFEFTQIAPRIKGLVGAWVDEQRKTEIRRKMRNIDVDLDVLRQEGKLKADETFIAVRVINSNIRQEEPPYIAFLTQSSRLAIFKCLNKPNVDATLIEADFTKGNTYNEWQKPFMKCRDGASLHGWDSVEVEYHEDRPLKANVDHVGHDKLLYNPHSRDLQANKFILREYDVTLLKLEQLAKTPGFDSVQVQKLIDYIKPKQNETERPCKIYKKLCKYNGQVYVSWCSLDTCDDWLSQPIPLFRGRTRSVEKLVDQTVVDPMTGMPIVTSVPTMVEEKIYETRYPFHLFRYQETEEPFINDTKGRAFLDLPKQEAQTCLFTNFVNQSCRSSNVYCSVENPSSSGSAPKRLDLELVAGGIYSDPLKFFTPPNPSYELIRGAQALDVQTQAENGQVAFAVQNRQADSRKTAEEVKTATQQQGLLTSVQVVQFSSFLRGVHTDVWSIVQAQALTDKIPFVQIQDPATGQLVNNKELLSLDYDVRAAGDADVIERAEKLQRRQTLWPIIASTPLASVFLQDLLKEMLPEDAERYGLVLAQAEQQQQKSDVLLNILRESSASGRAPTPEEMAQLEQSLGGQQPPSAVNNQQPQ